MKIINFLRVFLLITFIVASSSCSDDLSNPYLRINPFEMIQFSNAGGDITVEITTNIDDWSFTVSHDWLTATPTPTGVILSVEPYDGVAERKTFLNVVAGKYSAENKTIVVIQGSTFLTLRPEEIPVLSGYGDEFEVTVVTNAYDWTFVLENGEWMTATKTETGVRLSMDANPDNNLRRATLHVVSEKFYKEAAMPITQGISFTPSLALADYEPITLERDGDEHTIIVTANISDWEATTSANWLDVQQNGPNVVISAGYNPGPDRTTTVSFTSDNFPEVNKYIEVTQSGYTLIFQDDFSWLGIITPNRPEEASRLLGTSDGERAFQHWANEYGTTNGWESTRTQHSTGGNNPWPYSRYQFVKYGRGGNSADMITPRLTAIVGTQDIIVYFKVVGWNSSSELTDFTIRVEGGGTITEILKTGRDSEGDDCFGEVTPQGAHFIICNRWSDGNDLVNWGEYYAERAFVVEGATAQTQIYFIGDVSYQARQLENTSTYSRFGFDDVLIVVR